MWYDFSDLNSQNALQLYSVVVLLHQMYKRDDVNRSFGIQVSSL